MSIQDFGEDLDMCCNHAELPWSSFVLVVVLSAAGIFYCSPEPAPHPMDQSFVRYADIGLHRVNGHWEFHYPYLHWAGGISATLFVALYKLILNPSVNLNWHVKIFTMALWSVSLLMLTSVFIKNQTMRALALLCTAALGLQFLEPTSELISAIFLNFSIFLLMRKQWLVSGVFLALFSLAKVELLPISIILIIYISLNYRALSRQRFLIGYILCLLLLIGPTLYINGMSGILGGEKHALAAFVDHYRWLSERDIVPGELGTFSETFGNPHSFSRAVISNPLSYLNFVVRSSVLSAWNLLLAGNIFFVGFLLFMFGIRWSGQYADCGINKEHKTALALVFITVAATISLGILFAFVHIRYTTRFAALAVVLFVMMLEAFLTTRATFKSPSARRRDQDFAFVLLSILAIGGMWHVPSFLGDPHNW